LYMILYNVIF